MADHVCSTASQFATALTASVAGDVIKCDPSVIFEGEFVLPVKAGYTAGIGAAGGVRITTSATNGLPAANTRTGPSFSDVMPKFRVPQTSNYTNRPALRLAPGAKGWYLDNIEIRQSYSGGGAMLAIGENDVATYNSKAHQPEDCHVSQVYLNGLARIVGQRRGIDLHGKNCTVKHSYITGGVPNTTSNDAIGIWICNSEGTLTITNNAIVGFTENILFGGDEPKINSAATVNSTPTPTVTSCRLTMTDSNYYIPTVGEVVALPTTSSTVRMHPTVLTASEVSTGVYDITYAEIAAAPTAGGSASWGLTPKTVTINKNYCTKPLAWRDNPMIATPGNISISASGSGTSLTAGTYLVQVGARAAGYAGNDTASPPSSASAVNVSAGQQINVSWDAVTNGERYRVYVTHPDGVVRYKEVTSPTVSTTYTSNGTSAGSLAAGAKWKVKNLFEIKAAQAVTIEDNIFEQCWPGADSTGGAIWIKSVNQPNGHANPYTWTNDITFQYNIVRHCAGFMVFSGCEFTGSNQINRPKLMSNVTVQHNLMYDSSNTWTQGLAGIYAFNLSNGCANLTITQNTAISTITGNSGTMELISSASRDAYLRGLVVTNNLFNHGRYGVKGQVDGISLSVGTQALVAHSQSNYTFSHNALAAIEDSSGGYSSSNYPSGASLLFPTNTVFEQASSGGYFTNYAAYDFSLRASSPALDAGIGGVDLGCDVTEVLSRTALVVSGAASAPSAPTIVTTTLANGTVGVAYTATIETTGGVTPYSYAVTNGSLPSGLSLSTTSPRAFITGTPDAAGSSTFTITVTDSTGGTPLTDPQAYTVTIAAAPANPLVVTPGALPDATVGELYEAQLSVHGGVEPYRVQIEEGYALPDGLTLQDNYGGDDLVDNMIAGTPTVAGSTNVVFRVTDAVNTAITHALTLVVDDPAYEIDLDASHKRALDWEMRRLGNPYASTAAQVRALAYERLTPIHNRYLRAKSLATMQNYESLGLTLRDLVDDITGVDDEDV
jgi:hypothetical protein